MKSIKIYTDGSCNPNPGKGGWAFAISKKEYKSGKLDNTTNNVMEMTAIIEAVDYAKDKFPTSKILIYSDSKYCVNGFNSWMRGWNSNGWKKKGGPIKNLDLWKALWEIRGGVTLKWVRGHDGNDMNEFVDELAASAGRGKNMGSNPVLGYKDNPECYNHLIGIFQKHIGQKLKPEFKEKIIEEMKQRFTVNPVK